jgi:pimeloyl-ACP methyl ester carboxylesterase
MEEVVLSQGPIQYRVLGDGPPVVFVHGLLVDGRLWEPVAERLAARFRCIVPTLPLGSHRRPMAPDADLSPRGLAKLVADFLEALDLRDVTLVANDSGGAVSQVVAARHAERLARLVLTNCDALEVFPPRAFAYLAAAVRIPGLMWTLAQTMLYVPALRRLPIAYGALSQSRLPSELLAAWVEPGARDAAVRRDVGKFIRGIAPEVTLEAARGLASFRRPALLLWGADDRFFPVALARRLLPHFPDARLETIAEAKTFVPLDQPEQVAAAIERFALAPAPAAREVREVA